MQLKICRKLPETIENNFIIRVLQIKIVSAASVQDNLQHVCFVYNYNDYLTNTKNAVLSELINLLEWPVFVLKIEPVLN